jgi:uncharacterized protein (TIGR02569 family)
MPAPPPTPEILAAFRLPAHEPTAINAGQGDTFRVHNIALKRSHHPEETEWLSAILETLPQEGFRIARPIRSVTRAFVVDGWCAAEWLEGTTRHQDENWLQAIDTLQAFHHALRHVPDSPILHRADNPWTRSDALVWSDRVPDTSIGPTADRLLQLRRPVTLPAQLIQGDPGEGNMLFAPKLPPAIIDIAPYWHPATYSVAVFIADTIAWSHAPLSLLDHVKSWPQMQQLLLRAVLFRLYVGYLFKGGIEASEKRAAAYAPVIRAAENW